MLEFLSQIVLAYVCIVTILLVVREGPSGVLKALVKRLRELPGVDTLIQAILGREVQKFVRQIDGKRGIHGKPQDAALRIPHKGILERFLLCMIRKKRGRKFLSLSFL